MAQPIVRLDARNPGPMTGPGNHTYLVGGSAGAALVDAGVGDPRHLDAVDRALAGRALARVLVTHNHVDHIAGAAALAARHPDARFHKCPAADDPASIAWNPIADGDRFDADGVELVALHTPGHAPDHVAFWHDHTGTLFSGDLLNPGGSVMIFWSRGGRMDQYLASLERLLALAPRRLLAAHGDEVVDPQALIREHIAHRRLRERQIAGALDARPATVQAIAEFIYHGLGPVLMAAARENVRAHLEQLRLDGRAVEDGDGQWRATRSAT
jgi:glyoxylase-like metal-dependent hydrolase (beta-lactamase superfamily II)